MCLYLSGPTPTDDVYVFPSCFPSAIAASWHTVETIYGDTPGNVSLPRAQFSGQSPPPPYSLDNPVSPPGKIFLPQPSQGGDWNSRCQDFAAIKLYVGSLGDSGVSPSQSLACRVCLGFPYTASRTVSPVSIPWLVTFSPSQPPYLDTLTYVVTHSRYLCFLSLALYQPLVTI